MQIYVDPTEVRHGTSLPAEIGRMAQIRIGLEYFTGADIVIAPGNLPRLADDLHAMPQMLLNGMLSKCLLIQRKTGADMMSSIPNLREIQRRMLDVAGVYRPWLLPVGDFARNGEGTVNVNGRITGFAWNAFLGALDAWQAYGGCVHLCPDDDEFVRWVRTWDDKKLEKWAQASIEVAKAPSALFVGLPQQVQVLMGFPHVGQDTAVKILRYCSENLAMALIYISAPEGAPELEGVGPKMRHDWREFLGIKDGEYITVYKENEWTAEESDHSAELFT